MRKLAPSKMMMRMELPDHQVEIAMVTMKWQISTMMRGAMTGNIAFVTV